MLHTSSPTTRAFARVGLAFVTSWFVACADDPDTEAPAAPVVDPVTSPTSLATQDLTGSAEPGSTIIVAGGAKEATTITDSYTYRWRASVTLKPGVTNTLEVTATDGAGNKSLPTTVTVDHETPKPESLTLALDRDTISTDVAALTAHATISNDEPGVALDTLEVRFSVGEFGGVADQVVAADAHGHATARFEGLTVPGDAIVTATAVADESLSATAPFTVVPGQPKTFTVTLSDAGGSGAGTDNATVTAGADVAIEVTVTDSSGNPVDAPIALTTTAPGAILNSVLKDVTTAGTYSVTASLVGTLKTASATLTVTPGPAVDVTVALDHADVVAGDFVSATATAHDSFGNAVPTAAFDFAVDTTNCAPLPVGTCVGPAATASGTAAAFSLRRAGAFDLSATATFGGAPLTGKATAVVAAGPATTLTFDLVDAVGGGSIGDPASVAVGHELDVVPTLVDAYGNDVGLGVEVSTDIIGAIVGGHHLSRIAVAGVFHVIASVSGTSITTSRTITITPGAATAIALTAAPTVVVAGKPVIVSAKVLDAFGNDTGLLATVGITPTAAALDALAPACAGAQDPAVSPFIPCVSSARALSVGGASLAITASFTGVPAASVALTVLPAPAQTIAQFEPAPTGAAADGRINAGEDLSYVYRVEDAYGNPVDVPLAVTVTDPDAKILDDGVSGQGLIAGLVRASAIPYQVTARISGTGVTRNFGVTVDPAIGERFVTLVPSTSSIAMGGDVILSASARDLYGNTIPSASFAFTLDSSPCAPLPVAECYSPTSVQSGPGATFTINRVGVFALTASYTDANGTFKDSRYVSVQPVLDVTPPTITLSNVRKNGTLCATSKACTWQTGDTVTFEVDVVDDHGIAQVSYSAFFATAGTSGTLRSRVILVSSGTVSANPSFSFTIPNNNGGFEDVDLVAQAFDQVGNTANSAAWPIRIRAIDPIIADGKDRTIDLVGAVTGGSDIDDAVIDASGRLIAIDNNNGRLVQIVTPTSFFTIANLNTAPNYVAADEYGNVYVSGSALNGGNNTSTIVRLPPTGNAATYINVYSDLNTSSGTSGACEAGNGNQGEAMGLAVLPVLRGSVRISPTAPQSGPHVTISDASGTPSSTYTFGGNDVCAARDALRTAIQTTPFAGLAALRGPCTTFGTDYGDLELLADYSLFPGATDIVNASGNANILADSPIDLQPTLFFGSRTRYVHAMDATDAQAPSCYRVRYDFANGETRAVAANYEGTPAQLVIYGADRASGAIRRQVAATGTTTTIATLNTPHDLVVAPSGCVIATEENNNRVTMIDPNSASCSPLPCDTQTLASGFAAVRGLAIDSVDVVAEWTPWESNVVSLTARMPGAHGNSLPLSSNALAVSAIGFSGGVDVGGVKATGTILIGTTIEDGTTVTVGTHVYEIDLDATQNVAAGHVPVRPASALSADIARELAQTIRETEALLLVTDRTADAVIEIRPTIFDSSDCF